MKFFLLIRAESLAQRGFRQSGLRKILFSKNLDTKILITNGLAGQVSRWADRHCLDHDRLIQFWAQGQMSQGGCGYFLRRAIGSPFVRQLERVYNPQHGDSMWAN
jgi:hypothetical protein